MSVTKGTSAGGNRYEAGQNGRTPAGNGVPPTGKPSLALGMGAGMILATLLIGAGSHLIKLDPSASNPPAPKTSVDWKQAATKAGMVVLTKQELDKKLSDAKAAGAQSAATNQTPKTVHVYIQPGMGTNDVAMLLQAAGVIADGNALIRLRQSEPNPIRAGVYDLPLQADPKAVLQAIATPPRQ